jgi:hypothetical protein
MLKNSAETANAVRSPVPLLYRGARSDATLGSLGNTCSARSDYCAATFPGPAPAKSTTNRRFLSGTIGQIQARHWPG